jgi:predicted AlkP superfamily pyrophosphatase or phosphodiesterase
MLDNKNYIYPDYTNSLVNIPHSVLQHFGLNHQKPALQSPLLKNIQDCSKLILFAVDGFGYNFFKNEAIHYPFFSTIEEKGLSEKITSVFPSTTAAGITSLHTGLTPKEHGLLKWNLYFHEVDAIVQPLPYKTVQTDYHPSGIELPKDTKMLFTGKTVHELLHDRGIPSYYFIPKLFKDAVYTKAMAKGATIVQYVAMTDLFISLKSIVQSTQGKVFYYIYWGSIDTEEHVYGPSSEQAKAETALFGTMLQEKFVDVLDETTRKNTALLMTADHGQTTTKPDETIYLNNYPEVMKNFKISHNRRPILPSGNPRDMFLHIKEEKLDETVATLRKIFNGKADIVPLNDETITQLFGNEHAHQNFLSRLGNVLILPHTPQGIWYKYLPTSKFESHGHHGGLTADEMYIPFIAARLDQLC